MNRYLPSLRRVLALGGAAVVGLGAALALASPASAHHTGVTGTADCDLRTGEYVVTWTVTNDFPTVGTITQLLRRDGGAGATLNGIAIGGTVPAAVGETKGQITGTQRVPGTTTKIGLLIELSWSDGVKDKDDFHMDPLKGDCVKGTANPTATFATACDSVVTVHLSNGPNATLDAEFVVTGKDGWKSDTIKLGKGESKDVTVPAANSAHIEVFENGSQEAIQTYDRVVPTTCVTLPKTGAKVTAVAGGAVGLLAVGGLLFIAARRRRIRFTA